MKGKPILALGVAHLEHVFSPPGLPLPFKGEENVGTTSILVRGGPGSGKTTLALALAQSIAVAGDGLVLYLTTEFSPVEVVFKATMLGLPETAVERWPGMAWARAGAVLVEHLASAGQGEPPATSAERRSRSIEAVWQLLHPPDPPPELPTRPVRAVVIDALTLPDPGTPEGALRAELVAFVQALESEGRSVVLVEELAAGAAAWSAFVVDVVFDLAMVPHPRTGELRRKLTLSKSRFAVSIPGPHDYGLDEGRPVVWPSLFRVLANQKDTAGLRRAPALPLMLPGRWRNSWQRLGSTIAFLSEDPLGGAPLHLIENTPGVSAMIVECSYSIRLRSGFTSFRFDIAAGELIADENLHAVGWVLQKEIYEDVNTCIVQGLEDLVAREGEDVAIQMLEALRYLGYFVCVDAPASSLRTVQSMADIVWDVKGSPDPVSLRLRRSFALAALEARSDFVDGNDNHRLLWTLYYTGREWKAAREVVLEISQGKAGDPVRLLWLAICADVSGNRAATAALEAKLGGPDEPLILDPLLRALAKRGESEAVERIAAEACVRLGYPDWMRERMAAEAGLRGDFRLHTTSLERMVRLVDHPKLPASDRQDLFFNLAAIDNGDLVLLNAQTRRLLEAHPEFAAARQEVERLMAEPD